MVKPAVTETAASEGEALSAEKAIISGGRAIMAEQLKGIREHKEAATAALDGRQASLPLDRDDPACKYLDMLLVNVRTLTYGGYLDSTQRAMANYIEDLVFCLVRGSGVWRLRFRSGRVGWTDLITSVDDFLGKLEPPAKEAQTAEAQAAD